MKLLFVFCLFILCFEAFSQAPKVQGQAADSGVYSPNIILPENQATKLNGTTSLVETGNNNKLINPGFEHSTDGEGYSTSVTGTATLAVTTVSPSVFLSGDKSGRLTCAGEGSGGKCLFYQDVPTASIQGMVKGLLKSDSASGVKFYTRINGSNNLSRDIESTLPGLVPIPQTLGSTSTGIAVEITVGVGETINVDVDDFSVGIEKVVQDTSTCNSIECETEFSAKISNIGTVNPDSETYDWISSVINPSSGDYTLTLSSSFDLDNVMNCGCTVDAPTQSAGLVCAIDYTNSTATEIKYFTTANGAKQSRSVSIECTRSGTDFELARSKSGAQIYSQESANTNWESYTPTYGGMGTVTNSELKWRRVGSHIEVMGTLTVGARSGYASISLPDSKEIDADVITVGNTTSGDGQIIGNWSQSYDSSSFGSIVTATGTDATLVYFGVGLGSSNKNMPYSGSVYPQGSQELSVKFSVPIKGWEDSNVIVGSFAEMVKTPGIKRPKTCHYAFGGAGATLESPTGCTTGTCVEVYDSCESATPPTFSSTGAYLALTFEDGTWANNTFLDCSCRAYSTSSGTIVDCNNYFRTGEDTWASNSNGGYVANLHTATFSGSTVNTYITMKCTGQAP